MSEETRVDRGISPDHGGPSAARAAKDGKSQKPDPKDEEIATLKSRIQRLEGLRIMALSSMSYLVGHLQGSDPDWIVASHIQETLNMLGASDG